MEDKTLKQLQKMAIDLGIPKEDVDKFTSKAPLIATIKALQSKNEKVKVEIKKVKTLNPPPDPKEEKQIEKKWKSKAERMRAKLDAQPKVRFMIPCEGEEKPGVIREVMVKGRKEYVHVSGAYQPVTLNGYTTLVPKGKFVDIPQQVADVLSESFADTQKAGQEYLIDRSDPETGKSVKEVLS